MIDHLVYATPDLDATIDEFAHSTGTRPVPGGSHPGFGTRNFLVSLGGTTYLEIVGPDPDQPAPAQPRPFGIDDLPGPRLVTWCARPLQPLPTVITRLRDIGYDPGKLVGMKRRTPGGEVLSWQLTMPSLDADNGTIPFLIDWGRSTHPSFGLPAALALAELELRHPEPERVRKILAAIGDLDGVSVVDGDDAGIHAPLRRLQ